MRKFTIHSTRLFRNTCSHNVNSLNICSGIKRGVKIYTRTGDKGKTSLFSGTRVSKAHARMECLGTIDELNAAIGVAAAHCEIANNGIGGQLEVIQSRLLDVGSVIATPSHQATEDRLKQVAFNPDEHVNKLEEWIDEYDRDLPVLKNFIIPSGGLSSAHLHVARTICRKAERSLVRLNENDESGCPPELIKFLNRLSDFFFNAARYAALIDGKEENIYERDNTTKAEEEISRIEAEIAQEKAGKKR